MGRRLIVLAMALALLSGCAAFDTDNTPYEGFSPDLIPVLGGQAGPLSGYYIGDMTLDSNTCQGVSDEVGKAIPLVLDIIQTELGMSLTLEDQSVLTGALEEDNEAVFMSQVESTKQYFRLDFSEEAKITGSYEVKELDANGQYADPCASYSLYLEKGERPAAE